MKQRTKLLIGLMLFLTLLTGCFSSGTKRSSTYRLSGTVVDQYGVGIPGVVIVFESVDSSQDFGVAETDGDGKWDKKGLFGTVRVTPVKGGFVFDPTMQTFSKEKSEIIFISVGKGDYMGLVLGATWTYDLSIYEKRLIDGKSIEETSNGYATITVKDVTEREDMVIFDMETTLVIGNEQESENLRWIRNNKRQYFELYDNEDCYLFLEEPLEIGSKIFGEVEVIGRQVVDVPAGEYEAWIAFWEGDTGAGRLETTEWFVPYIGIIGSSEWWSDEFGEDKMSLKLVSYTVE